MLEIIFFCHGAAADDNNTLKVRPLILEMYNYGANIDFIKPNDRKTLQYIHFALPSEYRKFFKKDVIQTPDFLTRVEYQTFSLPDKYPLQQDKLTCSPKPAGPILVGMSFRTLEKINSQPAGPKKYLTWAEASYAASKSHFATDQDRQDSSEYGFDKVERHIYKLPPTDATATKEFYVRYRQNRDVIDVFVECDLGGNAHMCTIHKSLSANKDVYLRIVGIDFSCIQQILDISNNIDNYYSSLLIK